MVTAGRRWKTLRIQVVVNPFDPHGVRLAGPFHVALRRAVRERGLTLERLRAHLARRGLRVGLSSLSDWQTGRSLPGRADSLRVVAALEEVLELGPGALARLLSGPEGRRRVGEVGVVADLLDRMGAPGGQSLDVISQHHKVTLDTDGRTADIWSRTVVRAPRDGLDSYVGCFFDDCDPSLFRVEPLGNCRLGRRLEHPDEAAVAYELVFGESLGRGDTWVFDMRLTNQGSNLCSEFAFAFRHPYAQYVLEVRFDPSAPPRNLSAFSHEDVGGDRQTLRNLSLSEHGTAHLVASAVDSGVLGIAWDWT